MLGCVPFLVAFFTFNGLPAIIGLTLGGFILLFTVPVNVVMAQDLAPTQAGTVILHGHSLHLLSEDALATLRNTSVGFVFQTFQLILTLTALENVMVPAELRGDRHARAHAVDLLQRVGLGERLQHYPVQLSGGEQQRVALARAFMGQPRILYADEPTGNLDAETSTMVIDLLFALHQEAGTTLMLVTHDLEVAQQTQRIIRLKGGMIVADSGQAHLRSTAEQEHGPLGV